MTRTSLYLALMALLAACGDGQPFQFAEDEVVEDDTATEVIPEEVEEPEDVLNVITVAQELSSAREDRGDISRAEAPNDIGGGTSTLFSYNGDDDTFEIDGLAFDGLNTYQRFAALPQLAAVPIYGHDTRTADF